MTDVHEQPDDDQELGFVPALDDPELRQIEAELADRLIARPAMLDRGQVLHQAGWKAALEAKQEEEQVAASTLLVTSSLNLTESGWADALHWTTAAFTVAAVGIAMVLFTHNRMDTSDLETTFAETDVMTTRDTVEVVKIPEDQTLLATESVTPSIIQEPSQAPSQSRFLSSDQNRRPIYRAGAGSFSLQEMESLLSNKPTPISRDSNETTLRSSNTKRVPFRDVEPNHNPPTVFNLMREWAVYAPPKKSSNSQAD